MEIRVFLDMSVMAVPIMEFQNLIPTALNKHEISSLNSISFQFMLSGSPENWVTMNGNYSGKYYYRNVNGDFSYTEAKKFCESSGAKLAEPLDEVDNENLCLTFRDYKGTMAQSTWNIPYLNRKICLHCKYIQ